MKRLCSNSFLSLLLLFIGTTLYASLHDKSAVIYLGKNISYPMVGIHDYIIVDPKKTNIYTHGFDVYKKKIYAQIPVTPKSTLKSIVQDMQKLQKEGFENFYIKAMEKSDAQTISLLNTLSTKSEFQSSHILLHPSSTLQLSSIANTFEGIVLYNAQKMPEIKQKIKHLESFSDTIIDIETTTTEQTPKKRIQNLKRLHLIGYITNAAQDIYGYGVKNAIKREILTLIDDTKEDRIDLGAHRLGALPLEYQGYIQKLYSIKRGLPDPDSMTQYAGVIIWLDQPSEYPDRLISWVNQLHRRGIFVAFASNFGLEDTWTFLPQLDIQVEGCSREGMQKTLFKSPIMDYEIETKPLQNSECWIPPKNSKPLYTYQNGDGETSTPAAITPWGGYAIENAFFADIGGEILWSVDPFEFFKQALRLKPLPVPDPTTENGSRLFFSHVDGDGYVSRAEFDPEKLSGEVIYKEIFKKFKVPHSASNIGAEVMPNGLYPELSKRCLEGLKKIYALPNVEPATHTFTHTFFWGKIKNGNLPPQYRLAPKGYEYNLTYEIKGMLDYINDHLLENNTSKKARTVFWSGDCAPRLNAMTLIYKNHILNINGGDTTISNDKPWLARVAPLGLARGEYYQIYTGQQNENVFTNEWLGPFWGFKKVVQTFKLTDKPKRLKPIDIYYHFYSGSKKASLNALRYVFNWVLKQPDIMPIFTSSYIPKVMDYYTVSLANEGDEWLIAGMRDLKNLRLETKKQHIDYKHSSTTLGETRINNRTYIALSSRQIHYLSLTGKQQNANYLVSANAKLSRLIRGNKTTRYIFEGEVGVKLRYHLKQECTIQTKPKAKLIKKTDDIVIVKFPADKHRGIVDVRCR